MENWKDNNLSAILEYPFDFGRYIEERLREVDDTKERELAKVILVEGMGKIINVTEAKYQQLEYRVYKDFEIETNLYETVMTIVKRDCYDPTNHTLYPVIGIDLCETNLKQIMSTENEVWIGTIFMEMSEEKIKEFKNSNCLYGNTKASRTEDKLIYQIKPATRYRNMIEMMYQAFFDNHIPWETIHTGYLDKFFDIYIILKEESLELSAGPGKKQREQFFHDLLLKDLDFSLGKFEEYIRYDVIPLWNIEWITFENETFRVPCVDEIYFEHTFLPEKQSVADGYLIQNNKDILEIRHEKDRIVIKSTKENFDNWKAIRIIQGETMRSLDYNAPFLTNRKQDSFVRRYAEKKGTKLLTKAELFRKIMEMHICDYIEVVDYEIKENTKEYPIIEGMNWFVSDEVFSMDSRRILIFYFKEKQPGHYLNDSMVRFVVSQLQLGINEYRLVGEIITIREK